MSASASKTLEESTQPLDRPIDSESRAEEEKPREDPHSSEKVAEFDNRGQEEDDEEEEEEGECGFCLFMKRGGCGESFIAWEKCIEEAEKSKEDIVEKCFEVTGALKKCMEAHADYYEPVLRAEKAAEAEVTKELEKEAAEASAAKGSDHNDLAPANSERQGASNSADNQLSHAWKKIWIAWPDGYLIILGVIINISWLCMCYEDGQHGRIRAINLSGCRPELNLM